MFPSSIRNELVFDSSPAVRPKTIQTKIPTAPRVMPSVAPTIQPTKSHHMMVQTVIPSIPITRKAEIINITSTKRPAAVLPVLKQTTITATVKKAKIEPRPLWPTQSRVVDGCSSVELPASSQSSVVVVSTLLSARPAGKPQPVTSRKKASTPIPSSLMLHDVEIPLPGLKRKRKLIVSDDDNDDNQDDDEMPRASWPAASSASGPATATAAQAGKKGKKKKAKVDQRDNHPQKPAVASDKPVLKDSVLTHDKDGCYYKIPWTSLPEKAWKEHQERLTMVPNNEYLKRKGKDHTWARQARAVRDYRNRDGEYRVPAGYGLQYFGLPAIDKRTIGVDAPGLEWSGGQLWVADDAHCNQQTVVDAVLGHFEKYQTGGICELPTGSGKTEVAFYLACKVKKRALFLVGSQQLLEQTVERQKKVCPTAKLGIIQGSGRCEIAGMDIVVAMIKTVAECKSYDANTFNSFGFYIVDETEQVCAKVLSQMLKKVSHIKYGFGMSATVDRKDEMTMKLQYFIGPLIYQAPKSTPATRKISVQIIQFGFGKQINEVMKDGSPDFDKTAKALAVDPEVNAYILQRIKLRVSEGRTLVVPVLYKWHAYYLYSICRKLYPEINAVWYRRGMSDELKDFALNQRHQVIFSNVQLCGRGWDNPWIDVIMLVWSKPDVRQLAGRLRPFSRYKRMPLLIEDFAYQYGFWTAHGKARKKEYKEKGNMILPIMTVDPTCHEPIVVPQALLDSPPDIKMKLPLRGDKDMEMLCLPTMSQ